MRSTEENFSSLITDEADKIFLNLDKSAKQAIEILNNAPSRIKADLKREIIFESSIFVDDKLLTDLTMNEKYEIYLILQFND